MEKEMFFPSLWLMNGEYYEKVVAFGTPKFSEYLGVPITIEILKNNTDKMDRYTFGIHTAEFSICNLEFSFCGGLCHLIVDDIIIRQFSCVHELQMILFAFGHDVYANKFVIFKGIQL